MPHEHNQYRCLEPVNEFLFWTLSIALNWETKHSVCRCGEGNNEQSMTYVCSEMLWESKTASKDLLNMFYWSLQSKSDKRFHSLMPKTERPRRRFFPQAIRLLNKDMSTLLIPEEYIKALSLQWHSSLVKHLQIWYLSFCPFCTVTKCNINARQNLYAQSKESDLLWLITVYVTKLYHESN